jgi:hypothetical protein
VRLFPDMAVHVRVGLECDVFCDLGAVEVGCGVAVS